MSIPRTGVLDLPDDKEQNFWILSHAIELLEVRRTDQPFFMTLSFEGPHPPYDEPCDLYRRASEAFSGALPRLLDNTLLSEPLCGEPTCSLYHALAGSACSGCCWS